MTPELEERIYQNVLRSTIWDEKREDIFRMLEVNGLTGEAAEQMYRRARSERMATIRTDGTLRSLKGLLCLAVGGGILSGFWFFLGVITRELLIMCGLFVVFGAWYLGTGLTSVLMAGSQKGSLAQHD